jgi:hypothetical protein
MILKKIDFNNLVEILPLKNCDSILFSERLEDKLKAKYLTTKELEEKLDFCYSNSIFCEKECEKKENLIKRLNQNSKAKELEELIKKEIKSEDLIICKINQQVGYGVFANKDFQVGECILIYNGIIKEKEDENCGDYELAFQDENWWIDSQNIGNISRFIQHAPASLHPLNKINQKKVNKKKIFKKFFIYFNLFFNFLFFNVFFIILFYYFYFIILFFF